MNIEKYIRLAIEESLKGKEENEVPVGAVWVSEDEKIIIKDHNRSIQLKDPTAHAEILVIKEAAKRLDTLRIGGILYTTMIPCMMCAGAILISRINHLYYGVENDYFGTSIDVIQILEQGTHNHRVNVHGGYMENDIKEILKDFFEKLR